MPRALMPISILLALSACSNIKPRDFGDGTDGSSGDDTAGHTDTADADTDIDTDTDTDTTPDDSGASGTGFDDPGDVVSYDDADGDGIVNVNLTDASGDSNQQQEFYLVLVNPGTELGYRLRYYDADQVDRPAPPPVPRAAPRVRPAPVPIRPYAAPVPPPTVEDGDVGRTRQEFLVRNDLTDTTSFATVSATLWALGENVEIWVDDDVPIDWDYTCDGVVDVPDAYDAYGFDNCDLSDVADIIDDNIIPNVRSLYGDESDINGDGRVSVVITPELNRITRSSSDENDWSRVLPSYAEPAVDLTEFDYVTNPGSDEQEVMYVFAPDPNGFFNPDVKPTVEAFTGYQLVAEVARSFTALVSYNQHYQLHIDAGDGAVEEDWVNDILGTFAAEYCGFGAAYYQDAWEYLDAPYRFPLAGGLSPGDLSTLSRGGPYLFGLWLYQQAEQVSPGSGATLLAGIMQSGTTGVAAIEAGASATMTDLVLNWQVALLTSGVTNTTGDPLVDPSTWAPYTAAETIVAPPTAPDGHYGANGYQSGLNLNGKNHAFQAGTTEDPTEIASRVVKMENTDAFLYTPGFEFVGWMDADYTGQVVRLTGITYDDALVQLQYSGSDIAGAIVRWNDPSTTDFSVETIFSSTDSNAIALPALPADGSQIHGVGQISEATPVDSIALDGTSESTDIPDTDRWLLDLTDRPATETVPVMVWLDRHFADTSGTMGPDDPWVAVVPIDLVPAPTVEGTQGTSCVGGTEFYYPTSLLAHLTSQLYLSSTMYDSTTSDFDPCGDQSPTPTTCDEDWDRDGVLDADEPEPQNFFDQTRVMECTGNGNVPPASWVYDTTWLDMDELDDDDMPTVSYSQNAGGHAGKGTDGEEGFVSVDLQGGQQYLIVVGANANGTGTYELSVRETE
jgi:hypothetical protein